SVRFHAGRPPVAELKRHATDAAEGLTRVGRTSSFLSGCHNPGDTMSVPRRRAVWSLFLVVTAHPLAAQGLPAARPEDVGLSSAALDSIPTVLGRHVEAKKMAGAVVAVARHGKLAYLRAIGFMDVDSAKPMRTDAIFRVMSMAKPIV